MDWDCDPVYGRYGQLWLGLTTQISHNQSWWILVKDTGITGSLAPWSRGNTQFLDGTECDCMQSLQ